MQRGHTLEFACKHCQNEVSFSIFELDREHKINCHHCSKKYLFEDEILLRQLKKFEALCRQIRDSEEILGVDIDWGRRR